MKTLNFTTARFVLMLAFVCNLLMGVNESNAQVIVSRHESKVTNFMNQTARSLMAGISPNTGESAYGSLAGTWEYDEYEGEYRIPMYAYWTARTWAFSSDRQQFSVGGVLRVNLDGSNPRFTTTYTNRAVNLANSNNNWAAGSVVAIAALSVASNR